MYLHLPERRLPLLSCRLRGGMLIIIRRFLSSSSVSFFRLLFATRRQHRRADVSLDEVNFDVTDLLNGLNSARLNVKSSRFSKRNWLQVEIVGQLSGQMAEMVGGVVETLGEELESGGFTEQQEEATKVSYRRLISFKRSQ